MADLNDAVTLIVASRLPDASSSEVDEAVERAEMAIRAYCHIPDDEALPAGMKYVWADMAVAGVRMAQESADGAVSKITEGDTSVEYAEPVSRTSVSEAYAADLRLWRRVAR